MTVYYPFIHNPKKRREMFVPVPLHIEIEPPPPNQKLPEEDAEESQKESGVIIIQL